MLTRSIYSAISYAVVAAALSGQAIATPAEVNGVVPPTETAQASSNGYEKRQAYVAMNQRLGSIPSYRVTAPSLAKPGQNSQSNYNIETLDALEERMQNRLGALIELGSF